MFMINREYAEDDIKWIESLPNNITIVNETLFFSRPFDLGYRKLKYCQIYIDTDIYKNIASFGNTKNSFIKIKSASQIYGCGIINGRPNYHIKRILGEYTSVSRFDRRGELLDEEQICMNYLIQAWNAFNKLPEQHSSDKTEFINGIHKLQHILGMRILRREHPEFWVSNVEDGV